MVSFERVAPVFPVRDVDAAVEHYRRLGFDVERYGGDARYAFARRSEVELHLAEIESMPTESVVSAYFWVTDADALAAEWDGAGGRHVAPRDTDYGLREGAHIDPDGNLLRFGSSLDRSTSPEEWDREALFDDDYLHFYAHRVDDEVTDTEAEVVWSLLALEPGEEVLDLACGHGRISNRLAGRGAEVVGVDATPHFLDLAREDARKRGVDVTYELTDVRALVHENRFDAALSWFTAYGYWDDATNRDVLRRVQRALRPGGRFLIELNHKDGLLPHYLPSTVAHVGDDMFIDEHHYDPLTSRSNARRTTIRDGKIRELTFWVRMFSFTELRDWLLQAGFSKAEGFAGDGTPLTASSRRMIVVATK